jgi:hypothetical protein
MATQTDFVQRRPPSDDRFFLNTAVAMALVIVAGFSTQLAMGRSTFASPIHVHIHAVVFMGWVVIYVAQTAFVATGSIAMHRTLGWIATGWMLVMVVLGFVVTLSMVRRGVTPFFFKPLHFLVFDPLSVTTFAGLTIAAVLNRRRTDWHRRLHYCAMALLLGPAFGRLLPMPLLIPLAWEATVIAVMIFPMIGVIADWRRFGTVHPAWRWGIGTILASVVLTETLAFGPLGLPIYHAATAGTPGALVAPLEFPLPPTGTLRTGRPASI